MSALNRTKFLSDNEWAKLQAKLSHYAPDNPRDTTLIQVSMLTGARPSEVLNITKEDLFEETCSVFIKGLKGSRDREIPLPQQFFARFKKVADSSPSNKVFPIALRTYQGIWHRYRPARKGVKSLRHTFAIRLYSKTKDVRLVQMALGHKCMATTQVYVDYVYSVEEMKKLIL